MKLEINLKSIEMLAQKKFEENVSFFKYLKTQDSSMIDEMVHSLNDVLSVEISCVECGNCCHNIRPTISYEDMIRFIEPDKIEEVKYQKSMQCKHQKDKKCSIYNDRPDECKAFPYLDQNDFVSRSSSMIQDCEICPIVYNLVEQLKEKLDWKYQ